MAVDYGSCLTTVGIQNRYYVEGAIGQAHGNYDCHGLLGSVSVVYRTMAKT